MAEQAPDFLTVEETAKVLRIRRTAAYQLVNHDLATGGSDGLRARRFGKLIRIPRGALEELTGGPIGWPLERCPAEVTGVPARPDSTPPAVAPTNSRSKPTSPRTANRRQRDTSNAQLSLISND